MPVVDLLHPHPALLVLLPLRHQLLDVNTLIGKEMVGVMTETTIKIVSLMAEIAVVMMSRQPTVQNVNVKRNLPLQLQLRPVPPPQQQQQPQPQLLQLKIPLKDVNILNGKEMVGVMMETIIKIVILMVEIAVVTMSRQTFAQNVNAKRKPHQLLQLPLQQQQLLQQLATLLEDVSF